MILVYAHKKNPRVLYAFKQVFTEMLKVPVEVTTEVPVFIEHKGPKMSYAPRPLGNEVFFRNSQKSSRIRYYFE